MSSLIIASFFVDQSTNFRRQGNLYTRVTRIIQHAKTRQIALVRIHVERVSFHYGADHYGACQYGESAMAQVQLDAFQYGAFQYGAVPMWRCFAMTHSSMAQVQYGAFQFGAVPVWRLLRNIVLNAPCRVRLVCVFFKESYVYVHASNDLHAETN